MNDTRTWDSFVKLARNNGNLIEFLIKDFYANELLSKNDNALDGGAHAGFHTIPLADVLVDGTVVAIDANETLVRKLGERLADRRNVQLRFAALQDDPSAESITFNISTSHLGRSGVSRLWDHIAPGTVTYAPPVKVPATTIDKLVAEHAMPSLAFVKLDLEGGEFAAIRGARDTMKRLRPVFVTEHSVKAPAANGFGIEAWFDYMAAQDYAVLGPNGVAVTVANPFPFWYVFLVPEERREWASEALGRCVQRALGRLEASA